MSVNNLSTKKKLSNISFKLHKGEILGFFGLMGAGRTELAKAMFGYDKILSGEVNIEDRVYKKFNTQTMVENGLGYVTEDRKGEGIIKDMNLRENMTLPSMSLFESLFTINKNKEKKVANEYIKKFDVKTPSSERLITLLSGGNQQKILLSRWLLRNLKIIILDEPTKGIDVRSKSAVHEFMGELVDSGMSIIMISSELPEILGMCDRVVVMYKGLIKNILDLKNYAIK